MRVQHWGYFLLLALKLVFQHLDKDEIKELFAIGESLEIFNANITNNNQKG